MAVGGKTGGPFVAAAFLCEKVLKEQDGVVSYIRVVDRFTLQGDTDEIPAGRALKVNVVVSLKNGDARGKHKISVRPETPSGQQLPEVALQVLFEGDADRGVNVVIELGLPIEHEGLYWLDAFVDTLLVSRIPMRVFYRRRQPGLSGPI